MKLMHVLTHPYTITMCFFGILISGENWGGFYLLYLLLALPHLGFYAVSGFAGIGLLLVSKNVLKADKSVYKGSINILAVLLLLLSLFFFFYNDKEHYNYGTFYQFVPQLTLFVFLAIAVVFLIHNVKLIFFSKSSGNLQNSHPLP